MPSWTIPGSAAPETRSLQVRNLLGEDNRSGVRIELLSLWSRIRYDSIHQVSPRPSWLSAAAGTSLDNQVRTHSSGGPPPVSVMAAGVAEAVHLQCNREAAQSVSEWRRPAIGVRLSRTRDGRVNSEAARYLGRHIQAATVIWLAMLRSRRGQRGAACAAARKAHSRVHFDRAQGDSMGLDVGGPAISRSEGRQGGRHGGDGGRGGCAAGL